MRKLSNQKLKKNFPGVDFGIRWRIFKNSMIEPHQKDLSYRVAHQLLPTNTHLFKKHISKTKSCYVFTGDVTLQQLFLDCPLVQPFIKYVKLLLTTHNTPTILSFPDLIFYNFSKLSDPYLNRLAHYILSEIKYIIWHTCNRVNNDKITATTDTLIILSTSRKSNAPFTDTTRNILLKFG